MTVEELVEKLGRYAPDTKVLCESDSSCTFYGTYSVAELDGMPCVTFNPTEKFNEPIRTMERHNGPEKPPLGIKPRDLYNRECHKQRLDDLLSAFVRYSDAGKPIPREWVDELDFRIMKLGLYN